MTLGRAGVVIKLFGGCGRFYLNEHPKYVIITKGKENHLNHAILKMIFGNYVIFLEKVNLHNTINNFVDFDFYTFIS